MASLESLINGLSMGKLGDFEFYMHQNDYKEIAKNLTATFGSLKPAKGQEQLNKNGGYSQAISLKGVLVVQPLEALKTLEDYTKNREPIRFTTLDTDIEVIINSLNTTQKMFLDNGKFTVQNYSLSLKEIYDAI